MSPHSGQLRFFVAVNKNGGRIAWSQLRRMDFLLMALLYTLFFVALSYIIFAGRSEYHRGGWIGLFRRNVFSVSSESKSSDEYKFSNIT